MKTFEETGKFAAPHVQVRVIKPQTILSDNDKTQPNDKSSEESSKWWRSQGAQERMQLEQLWLTRVTTALVIIAILLFVFFAR